MWTEEESGAAQTWCEVDEQEFFSAIGSLNVSPSIVTNFPYTSIFKAPNGVVYGKSVDYYPQGSALLNTRYFVWKHDLHG